MELGGALKWSNFYITVNPNASANHPTMVQDLRYAADQMVQSDYLWTWLRQYVDRARIPFSPAERIKVETVRMRCAIEQSDSGSNQSHHLHIVLEIGHRTMVQIDIAMLKELFQTFTGVYPNIKVDFIKGSGENMQYILKYITKEVPSGFSVKRHQRKMQQVFGGEANVVEEFDANNNNVV
jgi:hypothetical protein